jgi:intracellular septation protein A
MREEEERDRGGFSLAEATGGPLGIAEATLPFIAFSVVWTATGKDVAAGAIVAVAIAAFLAGWRLLRRETVQFAISGLVGVAFGAFVAARTGEAKNFFLPGILINTGSCLAYLISIAVRRPLIGLFASALTGEGRSWYRDPERRSLYTKASWIWVFLFAFRLSIQLPLYLTDTVGALAIARVITGLPLFALGLWFTYLLLKPLLGDRLLTRAP